MNKRAGNCKGQSSTGDRVKGKTVSGFGTLDIRFRLLNSLAR